MDLQEITHELRMATDAHRAAAEQASMARRSETQALSRLNDAQKAFDKAVAEIKAGAPRSSGWKSAHVGEDFVP